jgi:hypothetical protein
MDAKKIARNIWSDSLLGQPIGAISAYVKGQVPFLTKRERDKVKDAIAVLAASGYSEAKARANNALVQEGVRRNRRTVVVARRRGEYTVLAYNRG